MEVVEILFNDLESNNSVKVEESKKKFTELFSMTKETWLVYGLMDYFFHTQSSRIVDILVKVQAPHDKFIFDRLTDWLHGSNKNEAISLFAHIVRKHPSWLHKVANHNLFKEILKLLKMEPNIISLMNALFCIIVLLPIIPTAMPSYLQDLFDAFLYLASWNCNNVPRLTDDQLIHLQIGMSTFFQHLYGMYPCNFISYLRDHVTKEKKSVFMHTIKPLLETVKMHPLLLTDNRETEKNNARWKEMEPHDVVFECSKFSLDYLNTIHDGGNSGCPHNYDWTTATTHSVLTDVPQSSSQTKSMPYGTALNSPFYSMFNEPIKDPIIRDVQKIDNNIWSPSLAVMATPPLTSTVPHTPTPSMAAVTYNIHSGAQLCSSASPPEAAVEATPETTPLKDDMKLHRQFPVNSNAVRAIWSLNSQPSSPMKSSTFQYPADGSGVGSNNSGIVPSSSSSSNNGISGISTINTSSSVMVSSPKIQTLVNDRNTLQMQLFNEKLQQHRQKIEILEVPESAVIKPINIVDGSLLVQSSSASAIGSGTSNIIDSDLSAKVRSMSVSSSSNRTNKTDPSLANILESSGFTTIEDQEVTNINRLKYQKPDSSYEYGDCESDGSPCSTGGLHIPNSRSMHNYAQRFQQRRIRNQSESTTSTNKSGDASPTDLNTTVIRTRNNDSSSKTIDSTPSDDDATKKDGKYKAKLLRSKRKHFEHTEYVTSETQTVEQVPQTEQIFLELFTDNGQKRSAASSDAIQKSFATSFVTSSVPLSIPPQTQTTTTTVTATSTTIATTPLSPHSLLDQYIETSIKKRSASDNLSRVDLYKDQIQLIHLQLQYERYRREMHAERNRRLLGKSRTNTALQMENEKLKEQKEKLSREIQKLTLSLNKACVSKTSDEKKYLEDKVEITKRFQAKCDENRKLLTTIDSLQRQIADDAQLKQTLTIQLENANAEIFSLENDLQQAKFQAQIGLDYKRELNRLQSEVILMGETQIKCKEKLCELANIRSRDVEIDNLVNIYESETKDLQIAYELKTTQMDALRARIVEQENQLAHRDSKFTEQKRILKTVKEEYQDKFKALEAKYTAQKAIILRLEEEILDLSKNSVAVNAIVGGTVSPDSEKTDMVGSLEHTSDLSISLASSEGLSNSLRSVTEIKNLHPLVAQTDVIVNTNTNVGGGGPMTASTAAAIAGSSGLNRQNVSDDIPVPGTHHHK